MKYKKYQDCLGKSLGELAYELGVSKADIVCFHNSHALPSQYVRADEDRLTINEILIPFDVEPLLHHAKNIGIQNAIFSNKARYRCEQVNIIKTLGEVTSFCSQKTQYLLQQDWLTGYAKVQLEDFIYDVTPVALMNPFELVREIEYIKNDFHCRFSLDTGEIEQIINERSIANRWIYFRENEFDNLNFIVQMTEFSSDAVSDMKSKGDSQFFAPNIEEYRRNLFNLICFGQYLCSSPENLKQELFTYVSLLLPPTALPLIFKYSFENVEDNKVIITKNASYTLSDTIIKQLKKQYDELLKPTLRFAFTEFKMSFDCQIVINHKEKQVESANIQIKEEIADNMESICQFNFTKLNNYTPS